MNIYTSESKAFYRKAFRYYQFKRVLGQYSISTQRALVELNKERNALRAAGASEAELRYLEVHAEESARHNGHQ